jgi:hypothetical protein
MIRRFILLLEVQVGLQIKQMDLILEDIMEGGTLVVVVELLSELQQEVEEQQTYVFLLTAIRTV